MFIEARARINGEESQMGIWLFLLLTKDAKGDKMISCRRFYFYK
jgi:hypothetical protein